MPKLVLMTRVLPFLEEDDINKLAGACKALRKLVFSPMGLKIIVFNRSRRMAEYFRDNIMARAGFQHVAAESDRALNKKELEKYQQVAAGEQFAVESMKEDQSEEINTLRNVKKFLTLKLTQNQVTLESMQNELVTANELLQKERRENRDIKEELSKMEEIRESNKEIVKEMNLKYANIVAAPHQIKEKELNQSVLKRENDQLKVHKALLEKEKEDLKSEISKTNQQREHYYEILVKIKNSFYQTDVMSQLQL